MSANGRINSECRHCQTYTTLGIVSVNSPRLCGGTVAIEQESDGRPIRWVVDPIWHAEDCPHPTHPEKPEATS